MIAMLNDIAYHIDIHRQREGVPYLVLLHGFMGSGSSFSHLVEPLSEFCNPVTIDLLGHGNTGGASSPGRYHWRQQVEDLGQILQNIRKEPLYLYGYSMGGRLALRYALARPKMLRGLFLESTHPGIDAESKRKERIASDKKRAEAILDDYASFLNDWQALELFRGRAGIPAERQRRYQNIQQKQDPEQMALSLLGFGNGQVPPAGEQLAGLDLPVLLLAGKEDKKYCGIMREMHASLPDSRLAIIDKAAHRVHLDRPDRVVYEAATFLSS